MMSKPFGLRGAIPALCLILTGAAAHAETEVPAADMADLLRDRPVICTDYRDEGSCNALSVLEFQALDAASEQAVVGFQLTPGRYAIGTTNVTISVRPKGLCYPHMADELLKTTFITTDNLDARARTATGQLTPAERSAIIDGALQRMADQIGDGLLCMRYFAVDDGAETTTYLQRSYIDGQPFMGDSFVTLFPRKRRGGLQLR